MTAGEQERFGLLNSLIEALGEDAAHKLMDALPPVSWDQVATKDDLNALATAITAKFDQVDAQFKSVNAQFESVNAQFEMVAAGFVNLRGEIAKEVAGISKKITDQTRIMVTMIAGFSLSVRSHGRRHPLRLTNTGLRFFERRYAPRAPRCLDAPKNHGSFVHITLHRQSLVLPQPHQLSALIGAQPTSTFGDIAAHPIPHVDHCEVRPSRRPVHRGGGRARERARRIRQSRGQPHQRDRRAIDQDR